MVFIPAVTYSFPTTSLSEEQCTNIQKTIKPALLSKMGLPPTLPNDVVYGDQYFGGIGLYQLFAEQGMNQTLLFLRHTRAQTDLGNQINIALRHYQLQAGIPQHVLEDTQPLVYLNYPWFDTLRQYLHQISGKLTLTDAWKPEVQREHDSFIMDELQPIHKTPTRNSQECMSNLSTSQLHIRHCYHLRKTTHHLMQTGNITQAEITKYRNGLYEWPNQEPKPNEIIAWKLWQEALCRTICKTNGQLHQDLGPWYDKIENTWTYWISACGHRLYQQTPQGWQCHKQCKGQLTLRFQKQYEYQDPPVNICPILPIENTNNILCTNYKSNRRHPPEPQTTPTSFLEYLEVNAQP
jgi:hypothetical protein